MFKIAEVLMQEIVIAELKFKYRTQRFRYLLGGGGSFLCIIFSNSQIIRFSTRLRPAAAIVILYRFRQPSLNNTIMATGQNVILGSLK